MNLASKKVIKNLLKKHRIRPSKKLGQNFLVDRVVVKRVVRAAELKPEDVVLEIGPGIGTLSQELAKKTKRAVLIEKDPKMSMVLQETLKNFKNTEIIEGDILKLKVENLLDSKRTPRRVAFKIDKVVANLPFYLTAPVIRKFLEAKSPPKEMILIIQKEVAQRIVARPPRMNLLAVSVQFYAKPKVISYISKKSFWPQPKVDGAIIKIEPKGPSIKLGLIDLFFKIVKAGFSQPRKQLINNLSKGLQTDRKKIQDWLLKNKIQPSLRAATLRIEDWIKLTKSFKINTEACFKDFKF